MESRYVFEKPMVGGVDFNCRSVLRETWTASSGPQPVYTNGPVHYSFIIDGGSKARSEHTASKGSRLPSGGRLLHDTEKTGRGDQKDTGPSGILKRASPTNCPSTNGQIPGSFMALDIRNPEKQAEKIINFRATAGQNVAPAEKQACTSSHIPVPRNRKPSGHADKEVMAATVLTSLSTSPLVLCPCSVPTVPEPSGKVWKDALSTSYSSSTSGNWSWDASDQSVPSTPSPPLLNDTNKSYLVSQGDDVSEDVTENTLFMFEYPIPRKRKMKAMFKCLWKNCEKVLSTSSGIRRHIRIVHLGRNSDSDYSDGEEDFYYSEIEVNMDSLSDGLSNLSPTSPTTSTPPPISPPPLTDIPYSENISMSELQSHSPMLLSQSAPSTLCHIRTDHAYQGPVTHARTVNFGERRQLLDITHATAAKNHPLNSSAAKATPGNRKPRGEVKKCRKVYGMEKRDMWCTACRWKKACQRFLDK